MTQADLFGEPTRVTPAFYNTNASSGAELRQAKARALTQEDMILAFFAARPGQMFTPEDAQRCLPPRTLITSVRRAITNLCVEGKLIKTDHTRRGQFGAKVHYWMLR